MKKFIPFMSRNILYSADTVQLPILQPSFDISILNENSSGWCESFGISESEAIRRFSHGDLCCIGHQGTTCLGMMWGHRGDAYVRGSGRRIDLDEKGVYLYGAFTRPEARGMGVFSKLTNSFLRFYMNQGINRFRVLIHPDNHISRMVVERIGFSACYYWRYIRIIKFGFLYELEINCRRQIFKIILKEPKDVYFI